MIKILAMIISIPASLIIFIALTICLYFMKYITMQNLILAGISLIASSIIIMMFRIIFPAKRPNKKTLEHEFLNKFGKKHKLIFLKWYKDLEGRKFASAHVSRIVILATIFYFMNELEYSVILLVFALIVGISRVLVKKHTTLDIFTGAAIGIITTYFVNLLFF
ncbi:phosphatase PAP2 family protein [Candidatus Woesearchaeota archaeon]|nr:phosphatase PAP2 family protein [Candidatus Woesearchaeota archaeon]MCF7900804.1 phosphatase PAP2 family protein [Candidatus Woesearchaeota archaeon]MCF8013106.1 phosphatase PAP2 family protein [Candidatus Woesearchaeota archaeon]